MCIRDSYNGKLRSAEVLLKPDGAFQKIRRAETPADYFATFDFTPFFNKSSQHKSRRCV